MARCRVLPGCSSYPFAPDLPGSVLTALSERVEMFGAEILQIVEGNEARIETLQHSLSEEAKARRKTAAFAIASVAVAVQGGAADVTTIGATLGWNAAKIGWAMEQIGPVGEVLRPIVESLKLIWPNIRFPF